MSSPFTSSSNEEQIMALNAEMAALYRAGVPLDSGLVHLGGDLPGRLGRLATAIGKRLEAGQDLSVALESEDQGFSPAYLAIIKAGVRSGKLSAALEGVAATAARLQHVRSMVGLALLYPSLVLVVAYALFLFAMRAWIPDMIQLLDEFDGAAGLLTVLRRIQETDYLWGPLIPLVVVLAGGLWWYRQSRIPFLYSTGRSRWPSIRAVIHAGRMACFCDVLRLLVAYGVPLPEALPLAGDASGERSLRDACREFASQLQRGTIRSDQPLPAGLPPLLGWWILTARNSEALVTSLQNASRGFHQQGQRTADWLCLYLPTYLTVGIGGTVVLVYTLLIFLPWTQTLLHLSQP